MDATAANPNRNSKSNSISPSYSLSPHQEELLFAALNSNNSAKNNPNTSPQAQDRTFMAPSAFTESPLEGAGSLPLNSFDESPFIDYDYEFDPEAGFDYDFSNDSQPQMIGNLPGATSSDGDAEGPDKRSHPDDEDDEEEGGGKRREGDEKTAKKPGRKPLTSEPTSVSSCYF
jgi:AP-1-like transcription factor